MDTGSISYRRAFEAYIRKGIPLALTLKETRPTTHYVWRTRGDGKVRPSHAANDGKIFAWDDPPPTGHPGEDYGCRCTAEPFLANIDERIEITLSDISDAGSPWSSRDFVGHYFNGKGRAVKVRDTGHLHSIVSAYMKEVEVKLKNNIARLSRQNRGNSFSDYYENTYDMTWTTFSIGDTKIRADVSGSCAERHGTLEISGDIDFRLEDEFVDPLDIGLEVIDLEETIIENIQRPIESRIRERINRIISDRLRGIKQDRLGIHTGEPYPITDEWSGQFEGRIYADSSISKFG